MLTARATDSPATDTLATRATVTVAVTMAGATRQPITATGTPRHITAGIRRATTPRPTILATAGSFVPPSLTTGVLVTTVGTIAGIVGNSRLAFAWVFGGRFRAAPLFWSGLSMLPAGEPASINRFPEPRCGCPDRRASRGRWNRHSDTGWAMGPNRTALRRVRRLWSRSRRRNCAPSRL